MNKLLGSEQIPKYIFVTGGVVSSLGKGIAAASLAAILESRRLRVTIIKLDPYLNVDPGTMNPFQHGEVYVTADGAETDLDLGHYERFISTSMTKANNVTSGQIYASVLAQERQGKYLGVTVQVIPHITEEIKRKIIAPTQGFDIGIVEIGGTVGDIESLPFLEAIRQMRIEHGIDNTLFVHLTLLPYIATSGEIKTKPTQHSVKELRSIGIQPDLLLCRSSHTISSADRDKIALFTNVAKPAVIACQDMPSILAIPMEFARQNLDQIVLSKLQLAAPAADLSAWQSSYATFTAIAQAREVINILIVGKYVDSADAYKSLQEALIYAGIHNASKIKISYLDATKLELADANNLAALEQVDGLIIPGGFGNRGIEGKIAACRYAREHNLPFLGICLGMQIAVIEFARNVLGLSDANSTEFDLATNNPVIALVTEWTNQAGVLEQRQQTMNLGGTMRLGSQKTTLLQNSLVSAIYQASEIFERHRHRYEVNEKYIALLAEHGMLVSGRSIDNLVETIEIPGKRWFIGCQFHPELTAKPHTGHKLFNNFIATIKQRRSQASI